MEIFRAKRARGGNIIYGGGGQIKIVFGKNIAAENNSSGNIFSS
jgi:hypothetical protein